MAHTTQRKKASAPLRRRNVRRIAPKKPVVVAVSGGFDPIHVGHVRLFNEAKRLGDKLVVILNNDNWLKAKKQHIFMPEHERREVLESIHAVDEVVLTKHGRNPKDMSVCAELRMVRPHVFANGGDRHAGNVPEVAVCEEIGARMVYSIGAGGKVQSSSWLLGRYVEAVVGKNPQEKKVKKK